MHPNYSYGWLGPTRLYSKFYFKLYNTCFKYFKQPKNTYTKILFDLFCKQRDSSDFKLYRTLISFLHEVKISFLFHLTKSFSSYTRFRTDSPQVCTSLLWFFVHDQFSLRIVGNVVLKEKVIFYNINNLTSWPFTIQSYMPFG